MDDEDFDFSPLKEVEASTERGRASALHNHDDFLVRRKYLTQDGEVIIRLEHLPEALAVSEGHFTAYCKHVFLACVFYRI